MIVFEVSRIEQSLIESRGYEWLCNASHAQFQSVLNLCGVSRDSHSKR